MPGKRRQKTGKSEMSTDLVVKNEVRPGKVKQEIVCIDLDEDEAPAKVKSEVKREIKTEQRDDRKKAKKASKVKREKLDDRERDKKQNDDNKESRRKRSRSRRKRSKSRGRSSSSSSSSSTESESEMYRRLKPYTKVQLVNLVRKADLNGMSGQVLHPSVAVSPCPPGCMLVRLDTGREIAVKPQNLIPLQSFHVGVHQAPQSQEARLKQVLKTIKVNVDSVTDRTMEMRSDLPILDGGERGPQGGIGHML